MAVCEVCGTDNREKARFCKGCARALVPLAAGPELVPAPTDAEVAPSRVCGACQTANAADALVCKSCGKSLFAFMEGPGAEGKSSGKKKGSAILMGAIAVVIAVAGAWWLSRSSAPMVSADPSAGSEQAAKALSVKAPVTVPLVKPEEAAKPSGPAPLPNDAATESEAKTHLEEVVKREAERTERARKAREVLARREKALAARELERERERAEQSAQALAAPSAPPSAPVDNPQSASKSATAPAAAAKVTVEQACSNASNFIARDLCRVDACRHPANAQDAICVWYRRLDEERKRSQGY